MANDRAKPVLLVTGASGLLGWAICQTTRESWATVGTAHRHSLSCPGVQTRSVDVTDYSALKQLFASVRPDAVIHAAALSDPNYCQEHPDESESVNVTASANIAGLCAQSGTPCAFTSSDLVFDGEHPPYNEESPENPISLYGEQKVRAEIAMRDRHPTVVACRLPLMFGVGSPAANGPFVRMIQAMKTGREVRLFVDEGRTPVSTEAAARGLVLALQKCAGGTLHLGGLESISRWDLGRLAAEVLDLRQARIVSCRQADVPMPAPRARDVSLDSTKARAIGYRPGTLREELHRLGPRLVG
ncbi:MAG: NAD(P)-dependent oxidoreductase [Sedimentisphaerales bacterium]|nr:NAD(P)-dependent oxidoreductase [Sedimentisphaerales bacterium]